MVMIYDTTFPLEERQWDQDSLVGKRYGTVNSFSHSRVYDGDKRLV